MMVRNYLCYSCNYQCCDLIAVSKYKEELKPIWKGCGCYESKACENEKCSLEKYKDFRYLPPF